MATATKNTATATADTSALSKEEKAMKKAASQRAVMDALNSASSSPWISGIPFSTYTDCYDSATGELKTFHTSSSYEPRVAGEPRKLKDDVSQRKIAGRIVLDKFGKEVKLYNGFIAHLANLTSGVKAVDVELNGEKFKFTDINGAQFGIHAIQTNEDSNQPNPNGGFYKVIKHVLQKSADEKKPVAADVA